MTPLKERVMCAFLLLLVTPLMSGGDVIHAPTASSTEEDYRDGASVDMVSIAKSEGKRVEVLVLQESGKPSVDSYARLLTPFPTLRTFTVCYRIRLIRFREESTLMSYAVSDDKDNELRIGQEQDSLGGSFQQDQSYSGEITQLSFWDSYLSQDAISRMARCLQLEEHPVLGWSSQGWDLHGEVYLKLRSLEEICSTNTRTFALFLRRFTLDRALHFCRVVGGILAVPKTAEENAILYEASQDKAENCSGNVGASYLWLGANDEARERTWVYWSSDVPITWENRWRGTGPNGGTMENCLVMLYGAYPGYWSDIACLDSYAFCIPCEFKALPVLHMKGPAMCDTSPFNVNYLIGEARNGQPSVKGFLHTDIYWDSAKNVWIMESLKEEASAVWEPRRGALYPFGTHQWRLMSDVCGLMEGTVVNLTLSMCGHGMFTCEDGTCISLHKRCDLRVDCHDQSDEHQCSLVDVPPDYQINIPPSPDTLNGSLDIHFIISINSFPSVATEDLTFASTFQLLLRWRDQRLRYFNLKTDRTLNMISEEKKRSIWTPRLFFSNAHGNVFTNLEQGSRLECMQEGNSSAGGSYFTKEVNIFSGSENSLVMGQMYSVTYSCDFDLLMFPFDAQVCRMYFTLVSASATYMRLVPASANYTGQTSLIEYSIGHLTMRSLAEEEFSSIVVEVLFVRRYGFYLLTLYIPTTLLIIIAYATLFFNPDDFNSRITVALTSLLVLSSLFTQTSNSLPKTSYFKMVDVWLFFSIVMIFQVVILQTLVDYSRQLVLGKNSRLARVFEKFHQCLCGAGNTEDTTTPVKSLRVSTNQAIHVKGVGEGEHRNHSSQGERCPPNDKDM